MRTRRWAAAAAGSTLASAVLALAATPAEATTWHKTCGPKIYVQDTTNIKTIRVGYIYTANTDWLNVKLNRGHKPGMGNAWVWWAKLQPFDNIISIGDYVQLNWTDYEPASTANYCRDYVTKGEGYALTWGVNGVPSSGNHWGKRMVSASGRGLAHGRNVKQTANLNPSTGKAASVWVQSF